MLHSHDMMKSNGLTSGSSANNAKDGTVIDGLAWILFCVSFDNSTHQVALDIEGYRIFIPV